MRHKKGYINQETGLVLWGYQKEKALWMTVETYHRQDIKVKAKAKAKYWENIEESRARIRAARNKHKEKSNMDFKAWASKNKHKIRCNRMLRKYGITNEDYHAMLEQQKNVCAICNNPQYNGKDRFLCVDHCHSTGKVRQLLCIKCNTGLGQFLDNPELLKEAAKYLEKHKLNTNP